MMRSVLWTSVLVFSFGIWGSASHAQDAAEAAEAADGSTDAGDTTGIPIPKTVGVVYWVDGARLVRLEKTRIQGRADTSDSVKNAVLGSLTGGLSNWVTKEKATVSSLIQGAASSVRVTELRPRFVTRMMHGFVDPQFQLLPVSSVRQHREVVAIEATAKVGQGDVAHNPTAIELDMAPHEKNPSVIVLTPPKDLQPGEYAMNCNFDLMTKNVHCFGVESGSSATRPRAPVRPAAVATGPTAPDAEDETAQAAGDKAGKRPKRSPLLAWGGASGNGRLENEAAQEALEAFIRAQEAQDVEATARRITRSGRASFRKSAAKMRKRELATVGKQLREADYRLKKSTAKTAEFYSKSANAALALRLEDGLWLVDPERTEEINGQE